MLRLASAFCAALLLHLLLMGLPLPDSGRPLTPHVSREVTIKLDATVETQNVQHIEKKDSKSSEPVPETREERHPAAESDMSRRTPEEVTRQASQPVPQLSPVHYKRTVTEPSQKQSPKRRAEKKHRKIQGKKPEVQTADNPGPAISEEKPAGTLSGQPEKKRQAEMSPQAVIQEASPLYRENPPPSYPIIAKRRSWEGRVVLNVVVNRQGRVKMITVKKSSGFAVLDEAALEAVENWRFRPGRRDGKVIDMEVEIPVHFKLE